MNDINVNIDTAHAVDIAQLWFGYKLIVLALIVAGFIAGFFLVRYFIRTGAGIVLPQAPNVRDTDSTT